ncbi:16S rRNA (cytosine(967)-C(5))-methyltransferase RsmB [Polynucleobacter sp. MWH-Loch1C5]|uniref:16S rRNA (cytosine(967)-C(5))-methyltransferase RsmB n=1 Tax=Polynucleobacter sp. MWH-Loch1C5 TaxID=2689108 RepID=UPI001C0D7CFD|nr:16S rRNA (cytosine(967)-C(5))-methyltransferase RsmB [Polynucleobacter sp. MWH-Loch1C5]MBU3542481.1 16S rRNA (cytosine(967)-C(5))-methyltransferase RsmB [Polynucleobacter sp. MWH-Loch1C5]
MAEAIVASAKVISQVQAGQSLSQLLPTLDNKLRPAVQSIVFQALRKASWADAIIQDYLSRAPSDELRQLLRVAIALLPDGSEQNTYSAHTLVNETVKAAALSKKTFHAKGLLNAVMRKLIGQTSLYQEYPLDQYLPFPQWWQNKIQRAYPDQFTSIYRSAYQAAPLTIRLNLKKLNTQEKIKAYLDSLSTAGFDWIDCPTISGHNLMQAKIILNPKPVQLIPGFDLGLFSVQDASAQLAAKLIDVPPKAMVLDACAAPGGKTAHILETYDVTVDAVEIDPERAARIDENLRRLGLENYRIEVADASANLGSFEQERYDAILADVPCSASGIFRRHPDIPYLRLAEDISQLVDIQRKILKNLWSRLKPGGKLLYVTCSIFPDEGEEQAQWLMQHLAGIARHEAPGQILPSEFNDGFYYALFSKQ